MIKKCKRKTIHVPKGINLRIKEGMKQEKGMDISLVIYR